MNHTHPALSQTRAGKFPLLDQEGFLLAGWIRVLNCDHKSTVMKRLSVSYSPTVVGRHGHRPSLNQPN
jgi:hypothetical protein